MKKRRRLKYPWIYAILGVVLLFMLYRAYPDDPEIISSQPLTGAAVSTDEAVQIIKDSSVYKGFDRLKRLVHIDIRGIRRDDPSSQNHYTILEQNAGVETGNDIYLAIVQSTSKCLSTSYIIFYVDAATGDILRTVRWRSCPSG